jgi:antitoxin YefM
MLSINYTELRKSLKKNLDLTSDNHETLIVHRPNGKSVVVLSLEDYNSMTETEYLFSSPKNAEMLMKSIQEAESGNLIAFDPTKD